MKDFPGRSVLFIAKTVGCRERQMSWDSSRLQKRNPHFSRTLTEARLAHLQRAFTERKTHLSYITLKKLPVILTENFVRVHKSFIVQFNKIDSMKTFPSQQDPDALCALRQDRLFQVQALRKSFCFS
ncbi:MAG: LytTR family transcriptional regulator [Bacteroidales bacterium]|nr:LytTR family transcriptional regulator [Bacteroidales bacterium]